MAGPKKMAHLFENRKKREYTLNVDIDTYETITRVAQQIGKSRPKVLAAFVESAYHHFLNQAKSEGMKFDPNMPVDDNHKPRAKKKR